MSMFSNSKYPNVEGKIRRALAILVNGAPFDASILMSMKLVEDESCPTAMTDGATYLHYNPGWFDSMGHESIAFVLGHEAMHKWSMHCFRGGGRNHTIWNVAIDFITNAELCRRGFKCGPDLGPRYTVAELIRAWKNGDQPAGFPMDTSITPKDTSEEIYDRLMAAMPPDDGKGGGGGGTNGKGPGTLDTMNRPAPANDPQASLQAVQLDIMTAAATAKAQGSLSENVKRILGEIENKVENWKKLMARFLQRARDLRRVHDTGYHRPSRRTQPGAAIILPARRYEPWGEYVIGVDTSGSVFGNPKELELYQNNVRGIMQQLRPKRITVVYCDSSVKSTEVFEAGVPVEFRNIQGGGGTSFVPVFEWVKEHRINPVALVYFTDTMGTFPKKKPTGYPVLWACTTDGDVPWGMRAQLTLD